MADKELRLRLLLDLAASKASSALKGLGREGGATADKLRAARSSLRELNQQQKAVSGFRESQAQLKQNAAAASGLREHLARLKNQMGPQTAAGARLLKSEITSAEKALRVASKAVDDQSRKLTGLRTRLRELGVKNVAAEEAADETQDAPDEEADGEEPDDGSDPEAGDEPTDGEETASGG